MYCDALSSIRSPLSDSEYYPIAFADVSMLIVQGHEDLRQDERVMQLFGLVNNMLANDRITAEHGLSIARYAVIPLSPNSGPAFQQNPICSTAVLDPLALEAIYFNSLEELPDLTRLHTWGVSWCMNSTWVVVSHQVEEYLVSPLAYGYNKVMLHVWLKCAGFPN